MSKLNVDTSKWVKGKNFPEWMDEIGISIISQGYLLPHEDVFKAFTRVSKAAGRRLKRKDLIPFFNEAIEKNWLCLASPVLSNLGTERGMPISCFGIDTDDSIEGIAMANSELMRFPLKVVELELEYLELEVEVKKLQVMVYLKV